MSKPCPDEFVEFGEILAETAAGPIRHYFQNPDAAPVEIKPDGSCYSLADKKGEVVMREAIRARYPGHGIVGEEFPPENDEAEFVWVLDPVDGTNGFVTGSPMFTTAIALRQRSTPTLGIINSPILGWRWPTPCSAAPRPPTSARRITTPSSNLPEPSESSAMVATPTPGALSPKG